MSRRFSFRARSGRYSLPLVLSMLAGTACAQTQQTADFTGGVSDFWSVGGNWNTLPPGAIPNNTLADTYIVRVLGARTCELNISPTIDKITIDATSRLNQANSTGLYIVADTTGIDPDPPTGTFHIDGGVFAMNSLGSLTDLVASGGAGSILTIGGGGVAHGRIEMSDWSVNRIYSNSGLGLIHFNNGLVVEGSGNIGANSAELDIGTGVVFRADQPSAMIFDPTDSLGMINRGLLIAENGGTIQLNAGPVDNANGVITSNTSDAIVRLSGADITDGRFEGKRIQLDSGSLSQLEMQVFLDGLCEVRGVVTVEDIENSGTIRFNNASTLYLSGTLTNRDTVEMNSIGSITDAVLVGDLTLSGAGEWDLSNSTANRIYGLTSSERLTNLNNSIRGAGQIGAGVLLLTNTSSGVIDANEPGVILTVDLIGDDSFNDGTLRASNEGILRISSDTIDQSVAGTGLIEAVDINSVVELTGGVTIIGGTTDTTLGLIRVSGTATLDSVRNEGDLRVPNASALYLSNTLNNNGRVQSQSIGSITDIVCNNNTFITGSGEFEFNTNSANRLYAIDAVSTITNDTNHTIRGGGQIGVNSATIVNFGLFKAENGAQLTVDTINPGVNSGEMRAQDTATLTINNGTYDNTSGQIRAIDNATAQLNSGAIIDGGLVEASANGRLRFSGGRVINTAPIIHSTASGLIDLGAGGAEDGFVNQGTLEIANAALFDLGGLFNNTGTVFMNAIGSTTDFRLVKDTTLTGAGEWDLNDRTANRIYGGGSDRLINTDNWIHGAGQIGVNLMTMTNGGVIEADETGVALTIDLAGADAINSGTLGASNGGVLQVWQHTFDQTGEAPGTIQALDASSVVLNACTFLGGTFETAGSGVIYPISTATLTGVTNDGRYEARNATTTTLNTALTNNGTIELLSIGSITDIVLGSDTIIDGTGEIILGSNPVNRIYAQSNHSLTNAEGHTIRGAGSLGVNLTFIVNHGRIVADIPGATMAVQPAPGPSLLIGPTGSIEAAGGALLRLISTTVDLQGRAIAETGSTIQLQSTQLDINGGTLVGGGVVNGSVNNPTGTVEPGDPTGTEAIVGELEITSDYTQAPGGTLSIRIDDAGDNTSLSVGGIATIDGTLRLTVDPAHMPQSSETILVLDAPLGISGSFASLDAPVGWNIDADGTSVRLVFSCAGDLTGDGVQNFADIQLFITAFQAGDPIADLTGDGVLNFSDVATLIAAFQAGC